MVSFLPQLVRRGFQTPYHFALSRDMRYASRPDVQRAYEVVAEDLSRGPTDDWNVVREKLANAQALVAFRNLSDGDTPL